MIWVVFGALFLTVVDKGLSLLGLSLASVFAIKGGVILAAAIIDALYKINFSGVTGTFTLDESGTPQKAAPVIEYVDGVAKFFAYV